MPAKRCPQPVQARSDTPFLLPVGIDGEPQTGHVTRTRAARAFRRSS
jgi:hypothetical protein